MTSTRRQRKWWAGGGLARVTQICGLAFILVMRVPAPHATAEATTKPFVSNPNTGLAIDGIDPVAYFVDARPLSGLPEFELRYGGAFWRFRNAGNLAAFGNDPDVYTPRYGGYDPVAVGRGVAVPGNPLLWLIYGERLYLFHTEAAREHFIADPATIITAAEARWPTIASALVP